MIKDFAYCHKKKTNFKKYINMFKFRIIYKQLLIVSFLFVSFSTFAQAPATFVHPGAFSSKEELDFVKAKIAAHEEPWYGAYNQLVATGYMGAYTKTVSPQDGAENAQRDDARKAYACALGWYYTGNVTYANTAIQVLNVWANTFNGYALPPIGSGNQSQLNCGWIGSMMGPAADIMLGYSGWAPADIAKTRTMFRTKFYPALKQMSTWNANNDLVQIEALIALSVFCEDAAEFNESVTRLNLRNPAYFYLSTDNAASRNYGGNAYPGSWFAPQIVVDGLTQETCRDNNHHAQFALTSAIHICEVAMHQGYDLYGQNQTRYVAALELMARQLYTNNMQGVCTNNVPLSTTGGNPADLYDVFEDAYTYYHNVKGLDLPYTAQELTVIRKNPAQGNAISKCDWNIFYETLTHADIVLVAVPKCSIPNLGIDQAICGKNNIVFNANVPVGNKTYTWSKDNVVIAGQTTASLTVTQAGTYKLDIDSLGCKTSDVVVVNGALAVNLGADVELCNPAIQTLDAGNTNGAGTNFLWNTGATTQTIAVSKPGTYSVTLSATNCASVTDAIVVTSKLLNTIADTTCTAGNIVNLTTVEGGSYKWYDVSTGGIALATAISYSPTITANKTYYVEDAGGATATLGKTVVGAGQIWTANTAADFSDAGKINQLIVAKALTLNSIAVYVTTPGNVTINLKQGGTAVYTKTVAVAAAGKQTINLGFTVAAGTYVLDAVGTTATINFEATGAAPAFPYVYTDFLTFTYNVAWSQTNGWYGYFYDIKFTAGNVCARTPVTAVVDPTNPKCGGTTVTQTITLDQGWNLISTNVIVANNTIESIFTGLDVQQVKNINEFWLQGQNPALNQLKTIEPGKGYLVKMNVAGVLSIAGTPMVSSAPTINTGWNLIGCSYQTTRAFSTLFNATNTETVKNFDGFWEPNGTLNSILNLEPGKAYYVKK